MKTDRLNWAAMTAGTMAIATLAVFIGAAAQSRGAEDAPDALVARLSAALDAASSPARPATESPEAIATAVRLALAATAPAEIAAHADFTSGWVSAYGVRDLREARAQGDAGD